MKVIGRLAILGVAMAGAGYLIVQQSKPTPVAVEETPPTVQAPPAAPPKPLSDGDRGRLCRAGIGNLMGRDPSTIRVIRNDSGIVTVRYTRSDGTTWMNQCRFGDGVIEWRGVDNGMPGRWRIDEHLEYAIADNGEITIVQLMAGEIIDVEKYDLR